MCSVKCLWFGAGDTFHTWPHTDWQAQPGRPEYLIELIPHTTLLNIEHSFAVQNLHTRRQNFLIDTEYLIELIPHRTRSTLLHTFALLCTIERTLLHTDRSTLVHSFEHKFLFNSDTILQTNMDHWNHSFWFFCTLILSGQWQLLHWIFNWTKPHTGHFCTHYAGRILFSNKMGG